MTTSSSRPIRLFISHSSADRTLVAGLVGLLQEALNLPAAEIRCTSLDGYGLPGGADTAMQLRTEVDDAQAFIGVVSRASLRSLYVLFELGARWGVGKHLLPVMAPGTPTTVLGGPLANLNALRADGRAQLLQLVTDLAKQLNISPQDPAAYAHEIDAILAAQPPEGLLILEAGYGAGDHRVDVTDALNSSIVGEALKIHAGNQLAGDPCAGLQKDLVVRYSYKGVERTITVPELQTLRLP